VKTAPRPAWLKANGTRLGCLHGKEGNARLAIHEVDVEVQKRYETQMLQFTYMEKKE
jgi:hypothetical protein